MKFVKNAFYDLNKLADVNLAEKWDNVGLMLGNFDNEVKKILVCLDVTSEVVAEAVENNIDLIVSHHPLIFKPLKKLDFSSDFKAKIIEKLIKNNISVISFHTNLDSAVHGLNDFLAKKLQLENISVLFEHSIDKEAGLGRVGNLSTEYSFYDFVDYLKEKFELSKVSAIVGDEKSIKTVAILGGSGGDFLYTLPEVDVYLTGDVTYHVAQDALEMKKNIIDIGHFSEHFVKDLLEEYLVNLGYNVTKSQSEKSPYTLL